VSVSELTSDQHAIGLLHNNLGPVSLTVADGTLALSDGALDTLQAAGGVIGSIIASDNGASGGGFVRASIAELISDAGALSKLSFADGQIADTVKIRDTAANISANLDFLNGDSQVGRINISDGQAVTVSVAQLNSDQHAIGLLNNNLGGPVLINVVDTTANFNNATITGFKAGVMLDLTDLNSANLSESFSENAGHTAGTLTLSDGVHTAALTLLGQYDQAGSGFIATADGHGGTSIAFAA
jgi:hypothetical protein